MKLDYSNTKYYYINLDNRTDRNTHMIRQFDTFNIKNYTRISATKESFGAIGCTKSHIIALKKFIDSGDDICFILEDDYKFVIDPEKYNELLQKLEHSKIYWNIVLLAGNILHSIEHNDFLRKCLNAQTTSGYMINKIFARLLLTNYETGLASLTKTKNKKYCIDQHWKLLQKPENNWFVFIPKCGKQMSSFSDIERRKVNYNC
jgi:GR25 family glycosyltransferase involved in LPS biosynthesis